MTLGRLMFVLSAAAAALLAVVVLRAESARLHFELSRLERRADGLLLRLHERELELARLGNPARILEQVAKWRGAEANPPVAEVGSAP